MPNPLWPLLRTYSWQELRHHPWRNAAAVVAVMLGVALAFAVHTLNASALNAFGHASRAVGGQPDLELRSANDRQGIPLLLWQQLRNAPEVALASPVLELSTYAWPAPESSTPLPAAASTAPAGAAPAPPAPTRVLLRVLGVDALQVASVAPDLLPRPQPPEDTAAHPTPDNGGGQPSGGFDTRFAVFAPDAVFLNPVARQALGAHRIQLQTGLQLRTLRVAGTVVAAGPALAVMDIAAAQDLFGAGERMTRIDLRLREGVDRAAFVQRMQRSADWPSHAQLRESGDAVTRMDALSRAYRVNLTVLALVALFTGGFLVFSVLALSVGRRAGQLALLAVLGLTARQRQQLVLCEAAALGLVGSVLGLALGAGLAAAGLRWLGGDLGGGYFSTATPALHTSVWAALLFGGLGLAAALLGAWSPARLAQQLPPAHTLKGLGPAAQGGAQRWGSAAMLVLAVPLALLPPIAGMPLAAYLSVALLLLGGIGSLPALVGLLLDRVAPWLGTRVLGLLAVERARRVRHSAAVAVSGVVAALSLAVALTVMVASFRGSVMSWLDQMLPADLYLRTAAHSSALDTAYLDPDFVQHASALPGVARSSTQRTLMLSLDAAAPPVALVARPLRDPTTQRLMLPLVGDVAAVPAGSVAVFVSEAMVDVYGAKVGHPFPALAQALKQNSPLTPAPSAQAAIFFVAGVWRDYARQGGTISIELADFERLHGDHRINDMAFWLAPDSDALALQNQLRALADRLAPTPDGAAGRLLDFGSASEIRATSLKIFDRSFAVTYWLQAVAIGIGLFGVAASLSAQVLARRKEFGLLAHLGLTRAQVLGVVALEGAAWTTLGAIAGLALGLAVAVVLVHVVNPQSFHWTMELALPWGRLLALCAAVIAAGTATAWLCGRAASGRDVVMAVKEDW